ncbi:uncharacterized protein LOC132571642 [Heteronotia binoei]|uniref:uncharacterized protein LOC132571642 n=1 Tax=Heteronotia binoei TaxID=13085 RepID=UPI00292CD7B2|nr:uncharacterized protein LOC132571642 [Heteronotia binoei]
MDADMETLSAVISMLASAAVVLSTCISFISLYPSGSRNARRRRDTFNWLVEQLRPTLERQSTEMREPVPVDERVAIAVWWLANTTSYRLVANQFGIARSTVAGIVVEVTLATEQELLTRAVYLGPYQRVEQIRRGFSRLGFPWCIAALDGCHVAIRAPAGQADEYINRKHFFSIILQATVDHTGRFTDVVIGYSGKCHDAYVLRSSNLIDLMDAGEWVPGNPTLTIEGLQVPPLILGDAAYPIRHWLMTPYTGHLSPEQARYNIAHSRSRCVVERAFGRLKARWRCLLSELPVELRNVNAIVASCVILHNLCDARGYEAPILPLNDPPVVVPDEEEEDDDNVDERQRDEGREVRSALTRHLQRVGRVA